MQQFEPGRRERKRRETRARIGAAALDLALEHGLEGATIDAISSAADVSPRTFFNYFDSKDEAILNMPDLHEADRVVAEVTATAGTLPLREIAVQLFAEWIGTSLESDSRRNQRRELMARHPHLFGAAFRCMTDAQDRFGAALRDIACTRGAPDDPDGAWADVAVAAAAAAVRTALKEWAAKDRAASGEHIRERANTLLIDAMENLT